MKRHTTSHRSGQITSPLDDLRDISGEICPLIIYTIYTILMPGRIYLYNTALAHMGAGWDLYDLYDLHDLDLDHVYRVGSV